MTWNGRAQLPWERRDARDLSKVVPVLDVMLVGDAEPR